MIIYKDIIAKLKDAGYNTGRLRKEKILSESTLQRLRSGRAITTETLDTVCKLVDCRVEDLIEFIPNDERKEENKNE